MLHRIGSYMLSGYKELRKTKKPSSIVIIGTRTILSVEIHPVKKIVAEGRVKLVGILDRVVSTCFDILQQNVCYGAIAFPCFLPVISIHILKITFKDFLKEDIAARFLYLHSRIPSFVEFLCECRNHLCGAFVTFCSG